MLSHGRLDLALVHLGRGEDPRALRVDFEGAPVEVESLYEEPLALVVGPSHRLAGRASIRWRDLADEEFVSFGAGSTVRELVAKAARQVGVRMRSPISATNLGTIRALVSAGLGVAILPEAALTLPGPPLHPIRLTRPLSFGSWPWRGTPCATRARPPASLPSFSGRVSRLIVPPAREA